MSQNSKNDRLSPPNCDKLTASSEPPDAAALQDGLNEFYKLHNSINSMQTEIDNLQIALPEKIERLTRETETTTRRLRNQVAEKQRELKRMSEKVGLILTTFLIGR